MAYKKPLEGAAIGDSNGMGNWAARAVGAGTRMIRREGSLTLMMLPGLVLFFLFSYLPMAGLIIAFKDFKFNEGIWGSAWQKPIFNNFIFLFSSSGVLRATRNTLVLNALFIFVGTIVALIFAISLNEVSSVFFKKSVQSLSFLPYFMSWIVISVMTYGIFAEEYGTLNNILMGLGFEKISWYTTPSFWPYMLVGIYIFKNAGYYAVIYLATIAGIDATCYEAAEIDGASRFQRIIYITVPLLVPTVIILTLLDIGRIMNADFGMFYGLVGDNAVVYSTTDVLDTYIYRALRKIGDIGMSSAASFYQSVVSFIVLYICNKAAKKLEGTSLF